MWRELSLVRGLGQAGYDLGGASVMRRVAARVRRLTRPLGSRSARRQSPVTRGDGRRWCMNGSPEAAGTLEPWDGSRLGCRHALTERRERGVRATTDKTTVVKQDRRERPSGAAA